MHNSGDFVRSSLHGAGIIGYEQSSTAVGTQVHRTAPYTYAGTGGVRCASMADRRVRSILSTASWILQPSMSAPNGVFIYLGTVPTLGRYGEDGKAGKCKGRCRPVFKKKRMERGL